jgi:tRNA (guanine-N7-)-methyltransferase
MGKDKIRRFAAIKEYSNVHEPVIMQEYEMKGKWRSECFKNDNPIVLELGCGKGEYSVGLAKHFPSKNFIGVDIKGARMFIGATEAIAEGLTNVAFLRTKIDFINDCFEENEVDEIWLTFSDPQPNKPNKRLSSGPFIERYKKLLKSGGLVHMKTDSDLLFEYTVEQIEEQKYQLIELSYNLYNELPENIDPQTRDIFHIKTHYEKLFTAKGSIIKYVKFRIN